MQRLRSNHLAALAAALLMLGGCSADPAATAREPATGRQETLGIMSSLPLYWPQSADLADLAAGRGPMPWQRGVFEQRFALVPLDTLSSVPGVSPDAPVADPIAGLARLAVIQPRGLSPADNVAIDGWVRSGGRLLLVLDPALTGEYDAPLGDPRRPVDNALIPPVVARWGLTVSFDEAQPAVVTTSALRGADLPLALAGRLAVTDPAAADCAVIADRAAATCRVGSGRVTIIADAALFEHAELAGENGAVLLAVLAAAFD